MRKKLLSGTNVGTEKVPLGKPFTIGAQKYCTTQLFMAHAGQLEISAPWVQVGSYEGQSYSQKMQTGSYVPMFCVSGAHIFDFGAKAEISLPRVLPE